MRGAESRLSGHKLAACNSVSSRESDGHKSVAMADMMYVHVYIRQPVDVAPCALLGNNPVLPIP